MAESDSLQHKIKKAKDDLLLRPSSNALFEAILGGLDSLVGAVTELHQLDEARSLGLKPTNSNEHDFVDYLKNRCDGLTLKNRELTAALFSVEQEQMKIQQERVELLETTQKMRESLDVAIKEKSSVDSNLDQMLDKLTQKEAALLEAQQESRRLRNLKALNQMPEKLADPETANKVRFQR